MGGFGIIGDIHWQYHAIKPPETGRKINIPRGYHGMCHIPGGDEGIRTLDTVAGILHFQCSALDQLCDVSGFMRIFFYSADTSAVSSVCAAETGSSTSAFSNSASISRSNGSSVPISSDSSPLSTTGFSLYD